MSQPPYSHHTTPQDPGSSRRISSKSVDPQRRAQAQRSREDAAKKSRETQERTEGSSERSGSEVTAPKTDAASVGRSSLLMASGTAVSRLLGVIKNLLMVAALGATGAAADAFDIANKIPNFLYAIIAGGALNAIIVPQVMRAYRSPNSKEILDKLLTLTATLLFGLTLLLTVGAPVLVSLYTTGDWTAEQKGLAVAFALWCIPQLFFYGLYTLLGQVLNARGQFGPYMWAPAVNNVISIIGFGVFLMVYGPVATGADLSSWDAPKIAFIGLTATLGIVAQAVVLFVPLMRSGFRWNIRFGMRGIGLRTAGSVAGWTFLALALEQVGVLVYTNIASAAPHAASAGVDVVAGNASYTQAMTIYLLPHSLVTVSVATALFTGISAAAAKSDLESVSALVSKGLRVIAVFTIFATGLFVVLSQPITKLLIPSLRAAEVPAVSHIVLAMGLGLMPLGAMVLMKWVYFAFEDGKSIFYFQIPVTLFLMLGSWLFTRILPGEWWVFGIGLSMTLSNLIAVLLRANGLRQKLGYLDVAHIVRLHVQLIVAAEVSCVVGWLVLRVWGFTASDSIVWAAVVCVIVGSIMGAVYFLVLQVMKVSELNALVNPIISKLSRSRA